MPSVRSRRAALWSLFLAVSQVAPVGSSPYLTVGTLEESVDPACWFLRGFDGIAAFSIANHGSFADGDTVTVFGDLAQLGLCSELQHFPDNVIQPWRDAELGCGVLSIDDELDCGLVSSDAWGRSLSIGSATGFEQAAVVSVRGTVDLECGAIPGCGDLCVSHVQLTACADSVDPVGFVSWGRIKTRYR